MRHNKNFNHLGRQAGHRKALMSNMASSLISNIFRSVAFPVFSSVQDDLPRLKRICRKNVRAIAFFIFPIMSLMIVVSYPLILIVLKEQWLPSVPYFRLLCFSGMCTPFIILFFDLFNIGEGENMLPAIVRLYIRMKEEGRYTRAEFLHEAARSIPGVYVPSFYRVSYRPDGTIEAYTPVYDDIPARVQKQG